MSSAPSLVGVAQASGATSRSIAFVVTGLCVALACSPKLAAAFLALPDAVVGAALMVTASFMVSGGIQIIAAHPLDTRKTFVAGISLFLGLSRAMFPSYYETLPHPLQAVTGSILSLAMVSAIFLNLLFHLGLRRATRIILGVAGKEGTAEGNLGDLIQQYTKTWGVDADVATRARGIAERAIQLIQEGRLADGPIAAKIAFDEVTFDVDIEYQGDLLTMPADRPISEENLVEEQPFVTGLSGFLAGAHPDRVRATTSDGHCRIRLIFNA
jgi:NCS2 family nucleobase:cation symporter-2